MSLISLTIPGDVAKKLIHYLKQKLPSSCLSDLFSSHAFTKHYLKRGGGGGLEDEELLGEDASYSYVSRNSLSCCVNYFLVLNQSQNFVSLFGL